MSINDHHFSSTAATAVIDHAVAPQSPVRVHNCSRIGLRANPPGFRMPFGDWFRRR
jgi:hypothetical protein